jgi:hypothetical protein
MQNQLINISQLFNNSFLLKVTYALYYLNVRLIKKSIPKNGLK